MSELAVPDAGDADVEVAGRVLRLTSLDRAMWPDGSVTKADVVRWYARVADVLLPHVRGRPLTLRRWPDGVGRRGFEQMECRGAPAWLRVAPLTLRTGAVRRYCVVDDVAGLVWTANLAALELHPYPTRLDEHDVPAALVVDLDPYPPAGLLDAARVALGCREALGAAGLRTWVKTSGGAGLHVWAPLTAGETFARTRAWVRALAERLASAAPETVTATTRPAERAGRVFVDWLQNDARRSTIAPYSLRVTPGGLTVSAPVTWEEVAGAVAAGTADGLRHDRASVLDRLERIGDPFADVAASEQPLAAQPGSG